MRSLPREIITGQVGFRSALLNSERQFLCVGAYSIHTRCSTMCFLSPLPWKPFEPLAFFSTHLHSLLLVAALAHHHHYVIIVSVFARSSFVSMIMVRTSQRVCFCCNVASCAYQCACSVVNTTFRSLSFSISMLVQCSLCRLFGYLAVPLFTVAHCGRRVD